MPDPLSRAEKALSSPEKIADELRAALEWLEVAPIDSRTIYGHENQKTHERAELDPEGATKRALGRVAECGTFPRGKLILHYQTGEKQILGAHQCRARICPHCARRRSRKLSEEMERAVSQIEAWRFGQHHVRLATLTIPNQANVAEGIGKLSEAWHRMLANRRFSRLVAGGFRCFEAKPGKDGLWNVHLHAIFYLWAPGIPYDVLRQCWDTAAQNKTGTSFNQRFDELRKAARPKQGESKVSAAARYLVKYLAKFEDLKDAQSAPGGLPHYMAALEGRRMFASWGIGAIARRKVKREKPAWTEQIRKHIEGYRKNGAAPVAAEIDTPWGKAEVPIPFPSMPERIDAESLPDQIEPGQWQPVKVKTAQPMEQHKGLHLLPKTKKSLSDWLGYEESKAKARERIWNEEPGTQAEKSKNWKAWKENNIAPELPEPFKWQAFWTMAPKEWTTEAAMLLGERTSSNLGALLWAKVKPSDAIGSPDTTDPRNLENVLHHAVRDARRTIKRHVSRFPRIEQRLEYMETMPAHLGGPTEGEPWHEQWSNQQWMDF